jgi:Na+/H+ antiporter NhaD/arsenite permease-like protein
MGMLLALGTIWLISEIVHKRTDHHERLRFTAAHALSRIDTSSVLFFLGILLAVSSLQTLGVLAQAAGWLTDAVGDMGIIAFLIGAASAIVDNVPVVAASMGMYSMTDFPVDHEFWHFLTYASGTGGSMLIIGSAAGVAVMGIEKIDFIWYLKKISWLALLGYVAGALWFFII